MELFTSSFFMAKLGEGLGREISSYLFYFDNSTLRQAIREYHEDQHMRQYENMVQ